MIEVNHLTLTYPGGKGVFDLNFTVNDGEIMGYLGPNGAGKTTTIRALMGFMKPDSGDCTINNLNCLLKAPEIQRSLGYIPGEISFIDGMNGDEYLQFISRMRKTSDPGRQKRLLEMFELDPRGKIKKFSKGMKQKLGIVAAFMHDPAVLILDEPTSGLDPLMQNRFVEIILEEKKRGKTILMSSHSFEEVEKTCDNVLIIKEGKIINQSDVQTLKSSQRRIYLLRADDPDLAAGLLQENDCVFARNSDDLLEVTVMGDDIDRFIKIAARIRLYDFDVKTQSLEDVFMNYYSRGGEEQ
jgi:ABC-2 type transport system ATP-binding protein